MYFNQSECGNRIKQLRNEQGLTQEQFSKHLNISDSHFRKIEAGTNGCSIDLLVEIAEYFDVSLDYLILGKKIEEEVIRKRIATAVNILNSCLEG